MERERESERERRREREREREGERERSIIDRLFNPRFPSLVPLNNYENCVNYVLYMNEKKSIEYIYNMLSRQKKKQKKQTIVERLRRKSFENMI